MTMHIPMQKWSCKAQPVTPAVKQRSSAIAEAVLCLNESDSVAYSGAEYRRIIRALLGALTQHTEQ